MSGNHVKIGQNGRLVLPAAIRRLAGLKVGDEVVMHVENGEVRLMAVQQAIRRTQEVCKEYLPKGKSMVGELIAERRREAPRE